LVLQRTSTEEFDRGHGLKLIFGLLLTDVRLTLLTNNKYWDNNKQKKMLILTPWAPTGVGHVTFVTTSGPELYTPHY